MEKSHLFSINFHLFSTGGEVRMLQIALCDNDIRELESVYALAKEYASDHPDLDISLRRFQSSYDLLESIEARGHYDIYLLDILMPHTNGIEAGQIIRRSNTSSVILYLTSSPDFALDSYSVKAQAYLLKPVRKEKLFEALDDAAERLMVERARHFLVRVKNSTEAIPYSRLIYVEYYKHRLICHLTNGRNVETNMFREPFEQIVKPLQSDSRFVKISSSFLVNMQYIRAVTPKSFVMNTPDKHTELTITRGYAHARQTYFDYMLETEDRS